MQALHEFALQQHHLLSFVVNKMAVPVHLAPGELVDFCPGPK